MSLLAYAKRYIGGFADSPATTSAIDAVFLNAVETALLGLLGANPVDGQLEVYDDALGRFKPTLITNTHIDPAAAIAKSKLANLQIADADVAAGAAIAPSKLAGNIPVSKLASYPADATKILKGDGSWVVPPLSLLSGYPANAGKFARGDGNWSGLFLDSKTRTTALAGVTATTFATSGDIFGSNLSFTADGSSNYLVVFMCPQASNTAASNNIFSINLDGSEYNRIGFWSTPVAGNSAPIFLTGFISAPSAGAHTVNIRPYVGGGSLTLSAGTTNGGAALGPMFMGIMAV